MITNPQVFDEEYLPRRLLHREREVEQLARVLEPAAWGDAAANVLIVGPSGVGKTVLARHTLNHLYDHAGVAFGYVRCMGSTGGTILRETIRAHPDVPSTVITGNTATSDLQVTLREDAEDPFVLVLDEADGVPRTSALDLLAGVPGLSVVAITHDADRWLAQLDDTQRPRFRDHRIALDRYGVTELADILERRARDGLGRNAVARARLEWIADEVAGAARFGIQALRVAAELATERDHVWIEDVDVAESFAVARRRIREANLRSLAFHHQVLYAIVREAGEISAGELHERYEAVSEAVYHGREDVAIGKRARREKLRKLVEYDLIEAEGERRYRVYRVCDGGIQTQVEID